ncbi:MAG: 30S ribosomal protein S3, partial [Schwartzia sp.]|nr:30S ribosomal protein S3 [Schwartzia sp. (in: firmicutes)]
ETERLKNRLRLTIHTAKPGMVIGRGGSGIEKIKGDLKKLTKKRVDIDIAEVKSPDLSSKLVAENVAGQLERRIAFRRAMKSCVGRTMRAGAKGVKIMVSGRLGGAEIARTESYREGSIPLHTLRADIDYGTAEASTTYGRIGVKVWIFKGEILPEKKQAGSPAQAERSEA